MAIYVLDCRGEKFDVTARKIDDRRNAIHHRKVSQLFRPRVQGNRTALPAVYTARYHPIRLAIAVNEALYIDIHVFRSHRNRSTFEISDQCACAMLSALRQPTGNAHAISAKVAPDRRRVISDAPLHNRP